MPITAVVLCQLLFSSSVFFNQERLNETPKVRELGLKICHEVFEEAVAIDVNPAVALSAAYTENKFKVGSNRSLGMMGVDKFTVGWPCTEKKPLNCDVKRGVEALKVNVVTYGCFKDLGEFSKKLLKTKGKKIHREWANSQPSCSDTDWDKVLCHYNKALKCQRSDRFAKVLIKNAVFLVDLLEKKGFELSW